MTNAKRRAYKTVLISGICKEYSLFADEFGTVGFEYFDCDGVKQTITVLEGERETICALEGSVIVTGGEQYNPQIVDNGVGDCRSNPGALTPIRVSGSFYEGQTESCGTTDSIYYSYYLSDNGAPGPTSGDVLYYDEFGNDPIQVVFGQSVYYFQAFYNGLEYSIAINSLGAITNAVLCP
jgi:hypothetical protein